MPEREKNQELFEQVAGRLRKVLELPGDRQLAVALGMNYSTLTMRKTRGALPTEQIDALVAREQLNPEYVYKGVGAVHVPLDGAAWADTFAKRVKHELGLEASRSVLVRQGYKERDLKAVQDGKHPVTAELLRDLRQYLDIDLNWLLCSDEPLAEPEKHLVAAYRRSKPDGQKLIDHAANYAAGNPR